MTWLHFLLFSLWLSNIEGRRKITNEAKAKYELRMYNGRAEEVYYLAAKTSWDYNVNMTKFNRKMMLDQDIMTSVFNQVTAKEMDVFDTSKMSESVKREIGKILDIGTAAQTNNDKLATLIEIIFKMESFQRAKVCLSESECEPLHPVIDNLMSTSRDYDRLLKAWVSWRDASGKQIKELYPEFVKLSNEALAILGHADTGAYWRSKYEMDNFEDEIKRLFHEIFPLYEHLHAYVRRKLKKIYGVDKFPKTGHIPAHLLGDMWAETWTSLKNDLLPFKNKSPMDVSEEMVKQGYTAKTIFRKADDFFGSLGLIRMPKEFWKESMLKKPSDGRNVSCQQSAWDFYNRKDYRIKMCTKISQSHLISAHHFMGHIEYDLQYKHLPFKFRKGANPGFHEAFSKAIMLSVQTPEHMQKLGLLKNVKHDSESDINFLMGMALQKIASLPFRYLVDQWRWSVFRGHTKPDQYNDRWWDLRCKYQGLSQPVKRTSSDFDPGAKYHIAANVVYIRYFVSAVLQFQFHKTLCDAAGHTEPLHRCDISGNKEAGRRLGNMLKLGSSKPWQDAMEQLTGQRKMSAQPLVEYFGPLLKFLKEENGDDHGWDKDSCPSVGSVTIGPSIQLIACLWIYCFCSVI